MNNLRHESMHQTPCCAHVPSLTHPSVIMGARAALFVIVMGFALLVSSACGGSTGDDSGGRTAVEVAVPTMPPARFTAVANQSEFTQTVTITNSNAVTESVAEAANVDPDLERGARSYAKNSCANCHGEQGEGVADKGAAIASTTLSLSEFDTLLRTGGGLGNEHIFGPSAVSPTGMETLHAYVQSLGQ